MNTHDWFHNRSFLKGDVLALSGHTAVEAGCASWLLSVIAKLKQACHS